jgi:hypothetical protein
MCGGGDVLSDRDRCVFCGALAIRYPDGSINTWVVKFGLNGAGPHEHETIKGES